MEKIHIYVKGRVQGVFYRDWTRSEAEKLGLTGWVRNLEDGRVEIVAEGGRGKLSKLIESCKKGPIFAGVTHLDVVWEKATGEFNGFEIIK